MQTRKMPKVEYGCLMVNYPLELSKQIMLWNNANIPDKIIYLAHRNDIDHGREHHVHTTVAYGFDQSVTMGIIKQMCYLPRLEVRLGKVSAFTTDKKFDVIKVDIESENLVKIRTLIEEKVGLPGNTHSVYNPHLTLAYVKKGKGDFVLDKEFPFTGTTVTLTEYEYSYATAESGRSHDWHIAL